MKPNMKKFTKAICFLLLFVVIFNGCKKKEDVVLYNGGITAFVDGEEWASYSNKTLCATVNGQTTITGTGADGSTILITLNGVIEEFGVYDLSSSGDGTAYYIVPDQPAWSSDLPANGGIFIINKIDTLKKIMSGTFYFYAYRQSDQSLVHISNGEFYDINYGIAAPGQSLNPNSLSVKIDGTLFKPDYFIGSLFGDLIAFAAFDTHGPSSVQFNLPSSIVNGNYTLSGYSRYRSYYMDGNSGYFGLGNITITNHNKKDKKIEGRFEFSTMATSAHTKSYALTDGSFSIRYQ